MSHSESLHDPFTDSVLHDTTINVRCPMRIEMPYGSSKPPNSRKCPVLFCFDSSFFRVYLLRTPLPPYPMHCHSPSSTLPQIRLQAVCNLLPSLELLDLRFPLLLLLLLEFELTRQTTTGYQLAVLDRLWYPSTSCQLRSANRASTEPKDSPSSSQHRSWQPASWPPPSSWPPSSPPRDRHSLPFARRRTNGRVRQRLLDASFGACGWSSVEAMTRQSEGGQRSCSFNADWMKSTPTYLGLHSHLAHQVTQVQTDLNPRHRLLVSSVRG